ncbi:hypothetical protein EGW08_013588 [Elysia chlorotica]|uniref:Cytochrome P450 n=1 Tax=Elysia chlorotica TaxID=188477 RepID=A0A3S0ZYY9_ELYCH|nr:hypothetical protein EGW08_013588 [Elysia chlorotica]
MLEDALLTPSLVYAVVSLALVLLIKSALFPPLPDNIPPFPVRPWPVLGHLPYLLTGQRQKLLDWRKTTGDIFSLYFGSRLLVILNGHRLVRDGLVRNADSLSNRPPWAHLDGSTNGIIFSNGTLWKEQRTVSIAILRSFGMGKGALSDKIHEEIASYLDALAGLGGKPSDVALLTRTSVSNVICSIIVGKRFEYNDPFFAAFMDSFDKQVQASENTAPVMFWPWLRHIPGNFMNSKTLNNCVKEMLGEFCDKFINLARKDGDENMPNCFIAEYWKAMKERKSYSSTTTLDETNLRWVLLQLFFAGTDTTSSTILWFIYYMLRHPHIQEEEEVHICPSIHPSLQPPISVPHFAAGDVTLQGYTIPAGATVLPNLDSVMMDEKVWEEPLKFSPRRFIDAAGSLIKHEAFMPFSVGRRMCMGEALANMELFLFLSCLVQRFRLESALPGHPPSVRPVDAIVSAPGEFHARFVHRAAQRT